MLFTLSSGLKTLSAQEAASYTVLQESFRCHVEQEGGYHMSAGVKKAMVPRFFEEGVS